MGATRPEGRAPGRGGAGHAGCGCRPRGSSVRIGASAVGHRARTRRPSIRTPRSTAASARGARPRSLGAPGRGAWRRRTRAAGGAAAGRCVAPAAARGRHPGGRRLRRPPAAALASAVDRAGSPRVSRRARHLRRRDRRWRRDDPRGLRGRRPVCRAGRRAGPTTGDSRTEPGRRSCRCAGSGLDACRSRARGGRGGAPHRERGDVTSPRPARTHDRRRPGRATCGPGDSRARRARETP